MYHSHVGFHANTTKGTLKAVMNAQSIGAYAMQMWLGNSKGYASKMIQAEEYEPVMEHVTMTDFFLISHSPYILNFARRFPENDRPGMERYVRDLVNIHRLGGRGSVLHMGCNTKDCISVNTGKRQTIEEAYETFVDNLQWVVDRVAESLDSDAESRVFPEGLYIILENMAGGGSRMCCEMEPWIRFWREFVPPSLKKVIRWCVDTAHLYAAGEYDLSLASEVDRFYADFEVGIGWENLLCFHYNGSKTPFGSHIDNHADIGVESCGLIGSEGMARLALIARHTKKPIILEVPGDEVGMVDQLSTIDDWMNCAFS